MHYIKSLICSLYGTCTDVRVAEVYSALGSLQADVVIVTDDMTSRRYQRAINIH